jgi:hypothetical protein
MAQLIYKAGQRRHLFAVRQLATDPNDDQCYVAGDLIAVYSSTDALDVGQQAREKGLVVPPYVIVHVTGYMLALTHQGQEGFRVWVVESDQVTHEQYIMSLVDMVRASWTVRKTL